MDYITLMYRFKVLETKESDYSSPRILNILLRSIIDIEESKFSNFIHNYLCELKAHQSRETHG